MPVLRSALATICLILSLTPAQAQQGFAAYGSVTYPLNANVFEVVGNSGRGYTLFWCGAAQYARRVLGAPWKTRIVITRGLGRSEVTGQRSAVHYTLTPEAIGVTPVRSSFPNAYDLGDSKSVTEANGFCRELIVPWWAL